MRQWPRVALGDVLCRYSEPAACAPDAEYDEITIRLWGKGVVSRGKVRGTDVTTPRRVVRANQLIFSKIDARNGAIGLVPEELDGAIVSNDFPSFQFVDPTRFDPAFMGWMVRSRHFIDLCKAASEGTTNRVRIKEDRFLAQQIALPPLVKQQAIVSRLNTLADKARQVNGRLDAIESDSMRLLVTMATRRDISDAERYALGWREVPVRSIAELSLDPQKVDAVESYSNIGIYSFARGLFEKQPIEGATTSAKTLYRIREGQFIYSRLFAFEGAYALVPQEFDGYFVSNEFPTFDVNFDLASANFLMALFLTEADWHSLRATSKGVGDRRLRIQPEHILARKIWLPPRREQSRVERLFDIHFALKARHLTIRQANDALIPATLERIFSKAD